MNTVGAIFFNVFWRKRRRQAIYG